MILVAYFSATGETARLAGTLARAAQADLYEIRPEHPYTTADLNWHDERSRSSAEMRDEACCPGIAGELPDLTRYDTVFVGFPIWWYTAPRIIQSFLESHDFAGKRVVPFATSGGSGLGRTAEALRASCPSAEVLPGRLLNGGSSDGELKKWAESAIG